METLGIDFGGSGIKGAIVDTSIGELVTERFRIITPQPSEPNAVAGVMKQIADHFNWNGKIGVGFPSAIQHGIVRTAANIDEAWVAVNGNEFISKKTGREVYIVNDADAAGLAEMNFGEGVGTSGLTLLLTVGTGIGSVLFMDGVLVPNTEFGHLKFKGTIAEGYASDRIRKQDELSWKKWAKRFNKVVNHMYELCYPDQIIIGGGVSKKFDKIEEYIKVECPVRPAKLMNEAGIIGAAMFAAKGKI
jgi:polyphosphate glucokinase